MSDRGARSWGLTAGSPRSTLHESTCALQRDAWDSSSGDELWKIFVTFGAESDYSLLMGKPPGDEQEALAPSLLSPGIANAL